MATRRRRRGTGLFLVKATKTGIYQIRGTVLGQPVRESTRTTELGIAESIRLKTEQSIHNSRLHGPQAVATFGEAVEDYLDANGHFDAQYRKNISALNDCFGDTLLSDIDQAGLQKFSKLHYPGNGPASINRVVYTPLIAIMRLAAENKKCALPLFRRPKIVKKLIEHAPDEWVHAFLVGCQVKKLRAIVWLLTTTGCRVTEACRIRWDHVRFDIATALIEKTKNGDARSLPIEPDLLELLKELKAEGDGHGRVFGFAHRTSVNQAIERESKRLGLRHYSSHKLGRHAIATRMLNAGHTCKEVADAVGWKKVSMVAENYGHLERSKVQASMIGVSKGLGTQANSKRTPETPAK